MNTPTIVCLRHLKIVGQDFSIGLEIPPGLLSREEIDRALDRRELEEVRQRRSLYRLLHRFSGCSESETAEEEREYTLED